MHAIRHFYPCDEPIMMQVERRRTGSKSSPLDGLHPIYDDDSDAAAACATSHSSMSTDKQDRSDCDSLESLAGFTMPPCEDERSEITTKMHNLSYKPRATVNSHNRYHNIGTHRLSSSCNSKPSSFGGVEAPTPLRNPGTALRKSSLCMESSSHTRGVPTPCSTVSMKRAADITHISTAEDVELSTNSDDLSVDALCASTGSTSTNRSAAVVDVEHGGMTMKESGTSTEETYQSGQATGTGNDRPKATLASSCSSFSRLLFLLGSILSLWVAIDNHTFTKELHASSNETPPTDVEAMDKSNRKRRMRLLDQSFGEDSPEAKELVLHYQRTYNTTLDELAASSNNSSSWPLPKNNASDSTARDPALGGSPKDALLQLLGRDADGDTSSESTSENVFVFEPDSFSRESPPVQGVEEGGADGDSSGANETESVLSYEKDSQSKEPSAFEGVSDYDSDSSSADSDERVTESDDASIFRLKQVGVDVTKCMILAFAGSLCFALVGIIDGALQAKAYNLFLFVSGVFGMLSAYERHSSSVFHILSIHGYLMFGMLVLWVHWQDMRRLSRPATTKDVMLLLADFIFATSQVLSVVSAYLYMCYDEAEASFIIQRAEEQVVAATLWLVSATIQFCSHMSA